MKTIKEEVLGRAESLDAQAESRRTTAADLRTQAGECDAEATALSQRAQEYRALAEKA